MGGSFPLRRAPRRGRGLLFEPFGAFLVSSGRDANAFARRHLHLGAGDRPAKSLAGAVEPHRQLADARQRGSGRVAAPRAQPVADQPKPFLAALERLQFRRRAARRRRGEIVLDAPHADDARALAKIAAHDPNASIRAETEASNAILSPAAWPMKASRSPRRAIASSISGSPPAA